MTVNERALQLWGILALAARNRQVLTYKMTSKLIGAPMPAIGGFLEPIQKFCQKSNLPPLTAIVVSEEDGMPGSGFIAASDIPAAQNAVFKFDWLDLGAPNLEKLEKTCQE